MMQAGAFAFYIGDHAQDPEDLYYRHGYHVLTNGTFHRDVTKLTQVLKADKRLPNKYR